MNVYVVGKDSWNQTIIEILKGKVKEFNYVKINNFCSSKGTSKKVK